MENNTIPSADEVLKKHLVAKLELQLDSKQDRYDAIIDAIKEFAIFHTEKALQEASENALILQQSNWGKYEQALLNDLNAIYKTKKEIKLNHFGHGDCTYEILTVDKNSILNAYSLENIK